MLLFLFLVIFSKLFTSRVDNENLRLRLALAIHTGVLKNVGNYAIKMLPLVADKTIKDLSKIIKRSNILAKFFTH